MTASHIPVLLQEVLDTLNPKSGEFFIDGTLGAGGHASAIVKKLVPGGTFLGIDRDKFAVDAFEKKSKEQNYALDKFLLLTANYSQLETILANRFESKADGILLDLGISSDQLGTPNQSQQVKLGLGTGQAERAGAFGSGGEQTSLGSEAPAEALPGSGRGFSFLVDDLLLMTYEEDATSVYEHLRRLSEKELAEIIADFSQERFASKIASSIKEASRQGRMQTTFDLVEAIKRAVPRNYEKGRIHPATRTFMALRIYANKEMEHLDKFLASIPSLLSKKGRVGIISFHSLEDRRVKHAFKELERTGDFEVLSKKAITASLKEMDENPRSRSAKYRVLKKNEL
ncbi:MAG: 16S rRNA (cytosine(1402)-N(4))-methyltransferase RsmH [bacterium]|nr:16S rRNA (cytosine(1402)-N(4))-methyltransferase RsmH [bacterium]